MPQQLSLPKNPSITVTWGTLESDGTRRTIRAVDGQETAALLETLKEMCLPQRPEQQSSLETTSIMPTDQKQ